MDIETVASALKELGHPTRLGIYKRLVKAGEDGLPVGELQKDLDVPPSTLSHHISALLSVGLVKQTREGRILHCTAQYEVLNEIIAFLMEECCFDQNPAC
ncbi:metalloregulator ArsR/SmtB family transcription factor [Desulfovibrio sp. OttesenSCG-928-O18]|nr:metalloregulator ArsR/SmtB family transcription factor [Desulfovibrio sp. OttesenSCG-928-O18]